MASLAFDEHDFFKTPIEPKPLLEEKNISSYFMKEKVREEPVFEEEEAEESYVVERVLRRRKDVLDVPPRPMAPMHGEPQTRPLTPRKIEQQQVPVEFVSSPTTPIVEKKIREAGLSVEEIDEKFWAGVCCQNEEEIPGRAPYVEQEPMFRTRPKIKEFQQSSGEFQPNVQVFETSQGRRAYVNYGSVVEDSLQDEYEEEIAEDSILGGYEESLSLLGVGANPHDINSLFRYRAHRLYSDNDCF